MLCGLRVIALIFTSRGEIESRARFIRPPKSSCHSLEYLWEIQSGQWPKPCARAIARFIEEYHLISRVWLMMKAVRQILTISKMKWLTGWYDDPLLVREILRDRGGRVSFHKVIARDVRSLGKWFIEFGFQWTLFTVVLVITFRCLLRWFAEWIVEWGIEERLLIRDQLLWKRRKPKWIDYNLHQSRE